jgi:hypothetical protein
VRRWGTCESMGTVRETLDSYGSRRSAVATGRDNRGILSVKRTILGGGSGRPEDGRGSLGHAATLRFPSPLIEPDVRISRIRLSDWLHHEAHERITDRKRHVRGVLFLRPTTQLSLKDPDHSRCLQAHRQSPSHRVLRKHTRSQGPFLRRHYPASTVVRPCPTPACAAARSDVEAATLTPNGSPPITRNHLSNVPCPLPRRIERVRLSIASPLTASALSLSRPAQASLTLRPAGSLSRPQATFVMRSPTHAVTRICAKAPALHLSALIAAIAVSSCSITKADSRAATAA